MLYEIQTPKIHPSSIPVLHDDETISSFLSRLAESNGCQARPFCGLMKLDFFGIQRGEPDALQKLANLCSFEVSRLEGRSVRGPGAGFIAGKSKHRFAKQFWALDHGVVCLSCLAEDEDTAGYREPHPAYQRLSWHLKAIRTCLKHGTALTELPEPNTHSTTYDFALHYNMAPKHQMGALPIRGASAFERYAHARLFGLTTEETYLDALPLYAAIQLCEILGATAVVDRRATISQLSADEWWCAGAAGFKILQDGEAGVLRFLEESLASYDPPRTFKQNPKKAIGLLYDWLANLTDDEVYDPLRAVIKDFWLNNRPVGPNDLMFGTGFKTRKLHSLTTLGEDFGFHIRTLRKFLFASGHLEPKGSTHEENKQLLDANEIIPFMERLQAAKTIKGAATYTNTPLYLFRVIRDAGHIPVFLSSVDSPKFQELYCKQDLDQYMEALVVNANSDLDLNKLCGIQLAAKKSSASIPTIIGLLLAGELHQVALSPEKTGFFAIHLCPYEIHRCLKGEAPPGYTAQETADLLRTKYATPRKLGEDGYLEVQSLISPLSRRRVMRVAPNEAERFRNEYISVGELADHLKTNASNVRPILARSGIAPAISYPNQRTHFFKRSDVQAFLLKEN